MRRRAEAPSATRFALAALAAWRVTHLLASEDGPGDAVAHLRARLGTGRVGALADCFQCLSVWIAAPLTPFAARTRGDAIVTWLALSGAACLLERAGASEEPELVQLEPIETRDTDGMLWEEPGGSNASANG